MVLLLVQGAIGPRQFVFAFTVLLVLQCLISSEVLATMTVFGAIALLCAIVLLPASRGPLVGTIFPVACCYVAAAALLAPFLYFALARGAVPSEPFFPPSFFSADLWSFLVPGQLMLVQPFGAARVASRFVTDLWENSSYFSLPLLAVTGLYWWPRRYQRVADLLALMLFTIAAASLGPRLHIAGRAVLTMPWSWVNSLVLIRHAMPVRFSNYAFLVLGIIVSLYFSAPEIRFGRALVVAVLIGLFPNPLFLSQQSRYDMPSFFTQGLYRSYLSRGENVLIIPYGFDGPSMVWQAESRMYFRMAGGYIAVITPDNFARWPLVSMLTNLMPVPDAAQQLRAFVAAYKIDTVILADSARGPARELPASLGVRPVRVGGVSLYRVPPQSHADPSAADLPPFNKRQ